MISPFTSPNTLATMLLACAIVSIGIFPASGLATVTFEANFDGYTVGALSGQPGWSINNGGADTQWIAEEDSANPSAPTSLPSGRQPLSPDGTQLLWLSPKTSGVSANQSAFLAFVDAADRIKEPFKLSIDILASPTGGSGPTFAFQLANNDNPTANQVPRFTFTSVSTSSMDLNIYNFNSPVNSVVSLPKNSWLRFEVAVDASSSTSGTYTVSVYEIDSSGSITGSLYTSEAFDYSLPTSGFNTLRLFTNSSRTDYWIGNITVATVPEPSTIGLFLRGGHGLQLAHRRRA